MKNLIYLGKTTAILSFIIGTTILSLFLYFDHSNLIEDIGFQYVLIAIPFNLMVFIISLIALIANNKHRVELLKTCGIMLLNIPIACYYFYIVITVKY